MVTIKVWDEQGVKEYRRRLEEATFELSAVIRIMLAQFGSTYCCEQFFSRMNFVKSKTRTRLTDLHLGNTLRVATSNFSSNLNRLVKDIHSQMSH
jgi:hypothetical protein